MALTLFHLRAITAFAKNKALKIWEKFREYLTQKAKMGGRDGAGRIKPSYFDKFVGEEDEKKISLGTFLQVYYTTKL